MTGISDWLQSWLFRRAPLTRSVVADRQVFDGTYWRLALPMDWTWKPGSGAALYFESGDGAKGLYLTALNFPSQRKSEASGTAKSIHEQSRQGLEALADYQWSVLEDDISASGSDTVGMLDAFDSSKGYRICTKVVVALPYAVRAAFHDYGCEDPSASRTYIDSIFKSLEVGRALRISPKHTMGFSTLCLIPSAVLSLTLFNDSAGAQSQIGVFNAQTSIGRAKGSASYDPQRQAYLIAGSGQNMWNDRDEFHFVWKRMTGNFILSTRARFIGAGVDPHRKIGWTIRPTLETGSPHVTAALHGDGLMSLQFRRTSGGLTEEAKSRVTLPDSDAVIQLERRDGVYVMSVARFGDTLVTQELAGVSLPDTVYVGLFVCAHDDAAVEQAAFSNVRVTTPAKEGLVAYRDYLGSNLEILDVATGNATIVHQYRRSFQAPEWTRDGKALIYAQEGLLYRFDLSSRVATAINTGFATRNNNDHVLSFDGRMLAISHHAVEDSGASNIYTVPATGGTPKRVTAKGPSYLHGWSPDGRWLVYTGIRGKELDVYKIPVAGGNEIRLTSAPGLDDGPEFTPDGTYVYFNSSRSGRMQIWRMRPDGSQQQQITNDGFNNWFPHISPDGKWIAYIAFPPDVDKDDHPFYKHVLLRLMPIGGGPVRVIAYVYGGQGTINVPSWSPDGKRLAFVSNSAMP